MTNRELIMSLMKQQNITNAEMSKRLSITQAALWDRLNTKKAKELTVSVFQQMLIALGYKLLIVPEDYTLADEMYEVSVSSKNEVEKK